MLFLLLVYFAVCIYGVKFKFSGNADYMSVENTQAIKGIFILMVFFSHIKGYVTFGTGLPDEIFLRFFEIIGQAMVALFLFYSGYDVMESIKKKGEPYIKKFPKNRVLATLFNFDLAVLLFLILTLILGEKVTVKRVLLSLIGWDALGNSNWYIFVILLLYLLTYVVFTLLKGKPHIWSVAVLSVITCVLIFVTWRYQIRPSWWYDTMLCYVLGMGYSIIRPKIEAFFSKSIVLWAASIVVLLAAYYLLKGRHIAAEILANLFFTVAVVLFTMHITLKNKMLVWCGKNLFELYILQRIPMIIFSTLGVNNISVIIYFVLCAAITALIAIVFKKYSNKLWKAIAASKNYR